jgi:hypothetical protein
VTTTATAPQGVAHHAGAVGADRVEGPLKGYHHRTFAVRLDRSSPLAGDFRWLKLREPRQDALWYDMRWFPSEEELLRLLHTRQGQGARYGRTPPRIPQVVEQAVDGQRLAFLAFIEGVTLDRVRGTRPGRVPGRYLDQIEELFHALAGVDAEALAAHTGPRPMAACARHDPAAYPEHGGATGFLGALTHFTMAHAYRDRQKEMAELLDLLGVPGAALDAFARRRPPLTDRPRTLLHGDLHRRNLVVDRAGDLWTIDWELALLGDPLYDLATHLHLMDYPADQEQEMVRRWQRAVGPRRSAGTAQDLPHYRAYKRVQSLCTDVLRATARLARTQEPPGSAAGRVRLRGAATVVQRVLAAAREPLRLPETPPTEQVEAVFADWWRRNRPPD